MPLYGMLLDNMPRIYLKDLYPFTVNTSNQVRLHNKSHFDVNKEFVFLKLFFALGNHFFSSVNILGIEQHFLLHTHIDGSFVPDMSL